MWFSTRKLRIFAWINIPLLMFSFCCSQIALASFWGSVGIKDEKEMGRKFEVMVRSRLPLVEDPEVALYIQSIVDKLSKAMPPQPFPFRSGVILHNALNAFAVPGGNLFVFTGLMMQLDTEAELAGVIAHEMAHVTQRHAASRIEKSQYLTLGSLFLAIAGVALGGGGAAAVGAMGAGQSAMLNNSRIDENEADHVGFQYLIGAGYPPQGMVGGFQKIRQKSWMSGAEMPAYLSTHPDLSDRISGIEARIRNLPPSTRQRTLDNRRFLRVRTLLWARYGEQQTAMQMFSKKNDGLSLMGKGILLSRQHNIPEANKAFAAAEAKAPQDPLILREYGAFQYLRGDTYKAETLLQRALAHDSHDYMAQFYYARLLGDTGRLTEAENYFREVLRYVPHDAEVHEYYARILGQSKKNFLAHLHLAYSAMYSNNKQKTLRFYNKARALALDTTQKNALIKFEKQYKERKEIWGAH